MRHTACPYSRRIWTCRLVSDWACEHTQIDMGNEATTATTTTTLSRSTPHVSSSRRRAAEHVVNEISRWICPSPHGSTVGQNQICENLSVENNHADGVVTNLPNRLISKPIIRSQFDIDVTCVANRAADPLIATRPMPSGVGLASSRAQLPINAIVHCVFQSAVLRP
jgi:hypothetical protein